ncbi:MAG: protein tyrosine phosphatase [Myxococcales bacterium]|nr:protein tyrosine phosphatase [Myxococcales bacterium]
MIDLHNHILPGVDDGSADMESSLQMGHILSELGFRSIAASPHLGVGPGGDVSPATATRVREELGEAFRAEGIELELLPNSEHHVTFELFERIEKSGVVSVGGESRWLLVELPWMRITNVFEILFRIRVKGFKLLLAHPERYKYLSVEDAAELVRQGVRLQLDIGSFVGLYGTKALDKAKAYMDADLGHVFATDLHSPDQAKDWLHEAMSLVEKNWGQDVLTRGLVDNPRSIVADMSAEEILSVGGGE